MSGRLARLLAAFMTLPATVAAAADSRHFPGVFGKDDREVVAKSDTRLNAVGHINFAGFRRKRSCTGTLVAPDLVVTAAHCLVQRSSGKTRALRNVHFVAGVRLGDHLGHAKAKCVHLLQPEGVPEPRTLGQLKSDVAVVVLSKKLDIAPMPLATERSFEKGVPLVHPSYPRDRRYLLSADTRCSLRAQTKGLWLTDCDTNFASSGGPVLTLKDEQYRLAAVMVGIVRHKFSVAVPVSAWRHLTERRDCP